MSNQFGEAQAYAEMTLFTRVVRYSVSNDMFGTARNALDQWQSCLQGEVVFVESPANQADLQIVFRPTTRFNGRDVMGLATTRRSVKAWYGDEFTYRVTGSIEIATYTPDGKFASLETMTNTTLHEVGHFLGLDDSRGKGFVMGPINPRRPVTFPDPAEVQCLIDLREMTDLLLRQATAESSSSRSMGR